MTPQEIKYMEIENYSRLQRIKRNNGDQKNEELDHEIKVSEAKLASLEVNAKDLGY